MSTTQGGGRSAMAVDVPGLAVGANDGLLGARLLGDTVGESMS